MDIQCGHKFNPHIFGLQHDIFVELAPTFTVVSEFVQAAKPWNSCKAWILAKFEITGHMILLT